MPGRAADPRDHSVRNRLRPAGLLGDQQRPVLRRTSSDGCCGVVALWVQGSAGSAQLADAGPQHSLPAPPLAPSQQRPGICPLALGLKAAASSLADSNRANCRQSSPISRDRIIGLGSAGSTGRKPCNVTALPAGGGLTCWGQDSLLRQAPSAGPSSDRLGTDRPGLMPVHRSSAHTTAFRHLAATSLL